MLEVVLILELLSVVVLVVGSGVSVDEIVLESLLDGRSDVEDSSQDVSVVGTSLVVLSSEDVSEVGGSSLEVSTGGVSELVGVCELVVSGDGVSVVTSAKDDVGVIVSSELVIFVDVSSVDDEVTPDVLVTFVHPVGPHVVITTTSVLTISSSVVVSSSIGVILSGQYEV